MTKLEALNYLLNNVGAASVTSLGSLHPQAVAALTKLDQATEEVQRQGWWFNRTRNTSINTSSNVELLAGRLLSMRADKQYVLRGNVIWDTTSNLQATSTITVRYATWLIDWDKMPSVAQDVTKTIALLHFVRSELEDEDKVAKLEILLFKLLAQIRIEDIVSSDRGTKANLILSEIDTYSETTFLNRQDQVVLVEDTLLRVSRQLQARGWWFNTELNKTVTKTDTGAQWISCSPNDKTIKWANGFIPTQTVNVLCDEAISEITLDSTPEMFQALVMYTATYDILKGLSKGGELTERLQTLAADILQKETLVLEEDLLNVNCTKEDKQILNTLNVKFPEFSITRRKLIMIIKETLARVSTETQNVGWWFNTFTDITADVITDAIRVLTNDNAIIWNPIDGSFTNTETGLTNTEVLCEQVIKEIPFASLPRSMKSLIVWKSTLEMASLLRTQNPESTYAREKERSTMLMVQKMERVVTEENLKNLRINKMDTPRIARVMHRIKPHWRVRN